jgi:hypothetical protein
VPVVDRAGARDGSRTLVPCVAVDLAGVGSGLCSAESRGGGAIPSMSYRTLRVRDARRRVAESQSVAQSAGSIARKGLEVAEGARTSTGARRAARARRRPSAFLPTFAGGGGGRVATSESNCSESRFMPELSHVSDASADAERAGARRAAATIRGRFALERADGCPAERESDRPRRTKRPRDSYTSWR